MKLRIDIVDNDDGIVVKFKTSSEHLQDCPHCLALMALKVANAFHGAVEDALRRGAAEDDADDTDNATTTDGHALH